MIDPKLEIMISRHLDGALSVDEELEFNREILRNPAARQLLDEYRRIDELSVAGFASVLDSSATRIESLVLADKSARTCPRSYSHAWWGLPAAVAAVLGFALFLRSPSTDSVPGVRPVTHIVDRLPVESGGLVRPIAGQSSELVRPANGPRQIRRDTLHDLFGIVGDDGRVYWLQVDHTRTVDRPDPSSAVRLANGDL